MTKGMQISLIACAVVVFSFFGAAYYLWNRYGREFMDNMKVAMDEAQAFALTTDQNGCVAAGRTRPITDTSVMSMVSKHGVFIQECLTKSKPVVGFCDSVPASKDSVRQEAWRKDQCAGLTLSDPRCGIVVGTVQAFCEGANRRG